MTDIITVLLWFSAIASGLLGGLSLAFSTFIPRALAGMDRAAAASAMLAMASAVERSIFMVLFYGVTASSLALLIIRAPEWGKQFFRDGAMDWNVAATVTGSVTYVFAVFFAAMMTSRNLKRVFARFIPGDLAEHWPMFLRAWTVGTLVPTFGSTVAMVLFIGALVAH